MTNKRAFSIRDAEQWSNDDDEVIELVFTRNFAPNSGCSNVERVSLDFLAEIGAEIQDYLRAHGIYQE